LIISKLYSTITKSNYPVYGADTAQVTAVQMQLSDQKMITMLPLT